MVIKAANQTTGSRESFSATNHAFESESAAHVVVLGLGWPILGGLFALEW